MHSSFDENPELPQPLPGEPVPQETISNEVVSTDNPEVDPTALRLEEHVAKALGHLEHNFIFRKLGIAYDYASPPKDFPRSTLPNVKETRDNSPNPAGIGTGMAECTANSSLLVDGYLTRLELGIVRSEEDRIMDRLIAGLIRIGTAGPRSQFVKGLTPDGRGFYAATSMVDHIHYAHALFRACHSPTIRAESQAKLRDICGKWMGRIVKNDYIIQGLTPEESRLFPRLPGREDPTEEADDREWERLITILHLTAITHNLQENQALKKIYDSLSTGSDGPNLKPVLPESFTDSARLLAIQIALADLASLDSTGPQAEVMAVLRRKIAYRAAKSLANYKNYPVKEIPEIPALDWRNDLQNTTDSEKTLLNQVYSAWPEVKDEAEAVRESARSMLSIILSGDEVFIQDNLQGMAEFIRSVPWNSLCLAGSIAPLPLAHALGQEKGLWDPRPECTLGNTPFGKIYGIDFEEGYKPLPMDGPRPKGWEHLPIKTPKIILELEEAEKQKSSPRPRPRQNSNNNNGQRRKKSSRSTPKDKLIEKSEPGGEKSDNKEKPREPAKRRNRGRRNRRRSSVNSNGRGNASNKPNNNSKPNSSPPKP